MSDDWDMALKLTKRECGIVRLALMALADIDNGTAGADATTMLRRIDNALRFQQILEGEKCDE